MGVKDSMFDSNKNESERLKKKKKEKKPEYTNALPPPFFYFLPTVDCLVFFHSYFWG
jgi:hypothetical protein